MFLDPQLTHAKAKPGRYVVDAKGETVLDTSTKLTWQRDGEVAGGRTWVEAGKYCKALAVAGGGWRLPTVVELHSLVDRGSLPATIDTTAFPLTAIKYYWSSTGPGLSTDTNAFFIYFGEGRVTWNSVTYAEGRVRCVR